MGDQGLGQSVRAYTRRRRTMSIDLNAPADGRGVGVSNVGAPSTNRVGGMNNVAISSTGRVGREVNVDRGGSSSRAGVEVNNMHITPSQVMIDVDASDDDEVVPISMSSYARAKSRSKRNRGAGRTLFLDEDSAYWQGEQVDLTTRTPVNSSRKQRRPQHDEEVKFMYEYKKKVRPTPPTPPPPSPPPPPPTFTCPICLNALAAETSTKCGHIFCQKCITECIIRKKECPVCRKKLTMKDTFRVYLPDAS